MHYALERFRMTDSPAIVHTVVSLVLCLCSNLLSTPPPHHHHYCYDLRRQLSTSYYPNYRGPAGTGPVLYDPVAIMLPVVIPPAIIPSVFDPPIKIPLVKVSKVMIYDSTS